MSLPFLVGEWAHAARQIQLEKEEACIHTLLVATGAVSREQKVTMEDVPSLHQKLEEAGYKLLRRTYTGPHRAELLESVEIVLFKQNKSIAGYRINTCLVSDTVNYKVNVVAEPLFFNDEL